VERRVSIAPGLWGVLATPFIGPRLALDLASLAREVEHYDALGAAGLTALGVFGEAAQLTAHERERVLRAAAGASELPFVVGVSALELDDVIEQTRQAVDVLGSQLAAVMIQVDTADAERLGRRLRTIHEATGASLLVQDYPVASGVAISPQTLADVVSASSFVVGAKLEAPPTAVATAVLASRCRVPVFGGLGGRNLLDELAAGAAGVMTGFSYPEALLATLQAWAEDGLAGASRVFAAWLPLVNFEAQPSVGLAIRKELLRRRRLLRDASVRPPSPSLPRELVPLLDAHLELACELLPA
jgi:4-hydroxy-tetrahydrodipicolinate synthase